jgi:hypothetical protein
MITKEEFDNYCTDKTIIMIGNGVSMLDKDEDGNYKFTGDFVDSHDIVLRFNAGRPGVLKKVIGTRTDILSLNKVNRRNHIFFPDKKYVVFPCVRLDIEPEILPITYHLPFDFLLEMIQSYNPGKGVAKDNIKCPHRKKIGQLVLPTTGITLLKYITDFIKFKSITIVGFDFHRTPTFFRKNRDRIAKRRKKVHDPQKQREVFTGILDKHKNITWIE